MENIGKDKFEVLLRLLSTRAYFLAENSVTLPDGTIAVEQKDLINLIYIVNKIDDKLPHDTYGYESFATRLLNFMEKDYGKIEISARDWNYNIQKRLDKLEALEQAGVHNWEGYDEALKCWYINEQKDEVISDFVENVLQTISESAEVEYPAGREAGHNILFDATVEQAVEDFFLVFSRRLWEVEHE